LGNIAKKVADQVNAVRSVQNHAVVDYAERGTAIKSQSFAHVAGCQAFQVGALGNFPYYWCDPRNLKFNEKTYKWISAGLMANSSPVELDQPFTNDFISVLSKVSYSLSSEDQAMLVRKAEEVRNQQGALLKAWRDAFGNIPVASDGKEPIDIVIDKITQDWASPPTDLQALQNTPNLSRKLNKIPPSGMAVLPDLINYLNALQSKSSLINATSKNQYYLQRALEAVQSPSLENGALETNTGLLRPAYFVSTPLEDILHGLNSTDQSNTVKYKMSVLRDSSTQCSVSLTSFGAPDRVPISDFLTIETGDGQDLFKDYIVDGSEPAQIELTFMGVTTVNFGPVDFSMTDTKHWYWISPINQAIANEGKDISGFKFLPKPQIEFARTGPFGFLTGVTIAKKASLTISSKSGNRKQIADAIKASPSVRLKFLKTPISTGVTDSPKYDIALSTLSRDACVVVNLNPSSEHAADSLDSTAFVLCVQTRYPSAG
jgi:hypothetical protein